MNRAGAIVVCGLGFGDEGKGTIVDALARRFGPADVVRFNGGPQCGHNVVTPDGGSHCFAQFGAGSFHSDSRTILGPQMLVELENLETEMRVLEAKGVTDLRRRLSVDPRCRLITPMQKFVGRMRELARGGSRHGSCGQGVGETVRDREAGVGHTIGEILYERLEDQGRNLERVRKLAAIKRDEARALLEATPPEAPYHAAMSETYTQLLKRSDAEELHLRYKLILCVGGKFLKEAEEAIRASFRRGRTLIFEGAQGALLDRTRGFVPYVTQSDTTCRHALDLLADAGFDGAVYKLGVLRAYGHRHGAGPFVTEDESLRSRFDDPLNRTNPWQGAFRVGWLDLPALRYGIAMNGGVDGLALTGLDRLTGLRVIKVCASYGNATGRSWKTFDEKAWIAGCKPRDWIEIPGWSRDISGVRRFRDLPRNARAFLRFLESADGLSTPIEIVSVGNTADHKLFLRS